MEGNSLFGTDFTLKWRIEEDITNRFKAGWLKWWNASGLLCDRERQTKLKGKSMTAIRPTMLYGPECLIVKKQHIQKISTAEMRIFRFDQW